MSEFLQPAIDTHAHFGVCVSSKPEFVNEFMSADAVTVAERARKINICLSVVTPLKAIMPRLGGNVIGGNEEAYQAVAETDGLLQWVVLSPLEKDSFNQVSDMLQSPKCAGIKIHPVEHGYQIRDHGKALFEFAAKHRTTILTHSGEESCMPEEYVRFADEFPEMNLILAHTGFGWDNDPTHQVRAIQASKHNNIFADTSSAQNIVPGVIEWAVKEAGAEKFLFGTDNPLYFLPMQRARIEYADISQESKRKIFFENAVSLLGLEKHLR